MRNWLRVSVALFGAVVMVLSGGQASFDGSYLSRTSLLSEQAQDYQEQRALSYLRYLTDLRKQVEQLNGYSSGHHQRG